MIEGRAIDLGRIDYSEARTLQLQLVDQRKNDDCVDTLLLCEHKPVITLGRKRAAQDNVLTPADVPVVEIERGGDATYHGPGQLVAYPIFLLRSENSGRTPDNERDLHRFLRDLEEVMLRTAAHFGVTGRREPGLTGMWVGEKKLGSIGISCRRWVTFHGIALNVTTALEEFARINPCGLESATMANLSDYAACTINDVKPVLLAAFAAVFARQLPLVTRLEV